MKKGNMIAIAVAAIIPAVIVRAQDITPGELLKAVTSAYESLPTYTAEGTVLTEIEMGSRTLNTGISFSILLKKPNLYRLTLTRKDQQNAGMNQEMVIWSDGTQPCFYLGMMNAWSRIDNDETALSAASMFSGGASFTVPSLFFSFSKTRPAPFSQLKNPRIERMEKFGGEDCYVVSGDSTASNKDTFWISKSNYFIVKYTHSGVEPPPGDGALPEITDVQLDIAIKAMGQTPSEETRKSMREMMKRSLEILKTVPMEGISTETHANISSPELNPADFRFTVPDGAVLKDNLFGNLMKGF